MKEELNGLANHIASAKGGLPQEWQDWAEEIEADIRKLANREAQPVAFYGSNGAYYNTSKAAIKDGCEDVTPLYTAPPAVLNGSTVGGWVACTDALPSNQEGRWSEDVIALSDSGDVFRLACMGGYWQRTDAFIESGSTRVTHWAPLPDEAK